MDIRPAVGSSIPVSRRRYTKPSRPNRNGGWSSASSGTTRPMLREPQHGSWLNMAESEIAVLTRQCLDRRIADRKTLAKQTAAWQKQRNKHHAKARWQFTTADARIKL